MSPSKLRYLGLLSLWLIIISIVMYFLIHSVFWFEQIKIGRLVDGVCRTLFFQTLSILNLLIDLLDLFFNVYYIGRGSLLVGNRFFILSLQEGPLT